MMIKGYDEMYLSDAMRNLGEAFDYAYNDCNLDLDEFMSLFIATNLAKQFENGNPKIISGLSGTELVLEVVSKANKDRTILKTEIDYNYSPQYWVGWILAYYQWETHRTFREIHEHISMKEIVKMYHLLHEAPEEKFIEVLNKIIKQYEIPSRLQYQRKKCGLSQKELAEKSGVNLRTIQQYEIGSKDINKASVQAVLSLVNALGCTINDIIEFPTK